MLIVRPIFGNFGKSTAARIGDLGGPDPTRGPYSGDPWSIDYLYSTDAETQSFLPYAARFYHVHAACQYERTLTIGNMSGAIVFQSFMMSRLQNSVGQTLVQRREGQLNEISIAFL